MNKLTLITLTAASTIMLGATAVSASDIQCSSSPQSQWRSIDDARAAAEALGYTKVRKVEIEDSCYEAYAFDKDGRRVEVYMDPVSLKVVRVERKS